MNNLPNELATFIFSFLPKRLLLFFSFSCKNKFIASLCSHDSIWRPIYTKLFTELQYLHEFFNHTGSISTTTKNNYKQAYAQLKKYLNETFHEDETYLQKLNTPYADSKFPYVSKSLASQALSLIPAPKKMRIVLVGNENVGKTQFCHSFLHQTSDLIEYSSGFFNEYSADVEFGEATVAIRIQDLGGSNLAIAFRAAVYYATIDVVLLCVSVIDTPLHSTVDCWRKELEGKIKCPILLVGFKTNFREEFVTKQVLPPAPKSLLKKYAKRLHNCIGYVECNNADPHECSLVIQEAIIRSWTAKAIRDHQHSQEDESQADDEEEATTSQS